MPAFMITLSEWLYRISSRVTVTAAVALYGVFLTFVMAPEAERVRGFAGDWGAPDGHLHYTAETFYAQVADWSPAGRAHYIEFRLGLDPLWALVYTAFLVTLISAALRRTTSAADSRRRLNLVPLLPLPMDLLENAIGIVLIGTYPARHDGLVSLASAISTGKWVTLGLAHLLMLYALAAWLRRARS